MSEVDPHEARYVVLWDVALCQEKEKERNKVDLKFSFKVQVTHISFSKNSSDLDEDFDDGLDGVRVDPSLDCTFSMDRVHDRVGIVRAVSLSQTLYRKDDEEKKNQCQFPCCANS